MSRTRINRNELVQASAMTAILFGVCPTAQSDGGDSTVLDPHAEAPLPLGIGIEQVLADHALTHRGGKTEIASAVPLPAAPPVVLIASGNALLGNLYAVYEDGLPTGESLQLLPRTRAALAYGASELLDENGALVALVRFDAELGTATLVENGAGRHVMALFITQLFEPVDAPNTAFAVESAVPIGEVFDLAIASSFVLQIEAWLADTGAEAIDPEAEGGVAVPVDQFQEMCDLYDAAQKQTCNIYLSVSIDALFAEPFGGIDPGPQSLVAPSRGRTPPNLLHAAALAAKALAPGVKQAVQAASDCHAEVDDWTDQCRTVVCSEGE